MKSIFTLLMMVITMTSIMASQTSFADHVNADNYSIIKVENTNGDTAVYCDDTMMLLHVCSNYGQVGDNVFDVDENGNVGARDLMSFIAGFNDVAESPDLNQFTVGDTFSGGVTFLTPADPDILVAFMERTMYDEPDPTDYNFAPYSWELTTVHIDDGMSKTIFVRQ